MSASRYGNLPFIVLLLALILAVLSGCSTEPGDITGPEENENLGDINLNGKPYEVADLVLLVAYFREGSGVFDVDETEQIAATDVNRDGVPLGVADLVYLYHIVVGDAEPSATLQPDSARVTFGRGGEITVDKPICAAFLVVEGRVEPTPLVNNMRISCGFDGVNTRILVYSYDIGAEFSGTFLRAAGNLVSIDLATSEGGRVDVIQDQVPAETDSVFVVEIKMAHDVLQGTHVEIPVTLNAGYDYLRGFDILIGYDASALIFTAAQKGALYAPPFGVCDPAWEYFNYRYNWNGDCGDQCPSGLIRVVGIGDTNDGPLHPDYSCLDALPKPYVLFNLDFLVTNDRTYECQFVPISFYWMDCGDNSVAYDPVAPSYYWVFQGVSRYVYTCNDTKIGDADTLSPDHGLGMSTGFPTYTGVQYDPCMIPDPIYQSKPLPVPAVDFLSGGIGIVCAEEIDDRGDINMNGVANEIADVILFANYFIYGLGVFTIGPDAPADQVAATDVNADGLMPTLADLVYLIRIAVGDAIPYPETVLSDLVGYSVNGKVISVSQPVGAAYVVVEGNVVPILLADHMDMMYNFDGVNTHILVWALRADEEKVVIDGDFLEIEGDLVSIELATYEGAMVLAIRE